MAIYLTFKMLPYAFLLRLVKSDLTIPRIVQCQRSLYHPTQGGSNQGAVKKPMIAPKIIACLLSSFK